MAGIRLSELYDRAGQIRSDLLPGQIAEALVSAARKLAIDTRLLEDVIPFTLEAGACSVPLELPAGRLAQSVKRVEILDDEGKWMALDGPNLYLLGRTPPESMEANPPTSWTTKTDNRLLFNCPADADVALRMTVAYVPSKDDTPEVIEFPVEAEEALVAWARSRLWEIAGRGQNLREGAAAARIYRYELPRLCHLADVGHAAVQQRINDFLPME